MNIETIFWGGLGVALFPLVEYVYVYMFSKAATKGKLDALREFTDNEIDNMRSKK